MAGDDGCADVCVQLTWDAALTVAAGFGSVARLQALLKPAELKALGDALKPVPQRKLQALYANAVNSLQVRERSTGTWRQ